MNLVMFFFLFFFLQRQTFTIQQSKQNLWESESFLEQELVWAV